MEGPPKTKNRTTTWSSNSTTVYISGKKMKALIQKDSCALVFMAALFTTAKTWKQTEVPINRWLDKEDMSYAHTYTYTNKKNEIVYLVFFHWIIIWNTKIILKHPLKYHSSHGLWCIPCKELMCCSVKNNLCLHYFYQISDLPGKHTTLRVCTQFYMLRKYFLSKSILKKYPEKHPSI